MGVKATDGSGFLDRLNRLSIDNSSAGVRILAHASPFSDAECSVGIDLETHAAELAKVIIDGPPGWKIGRQIPPRAAGAHEVKERIKDAPQIVATEPPLWGAGWQELLEIVPFGIG
jgi:hypothetical protein